MNATLRTSTPLPKTRTDSRTRGSIMLVGNFLSATTRVRSVCEELASRLSLAGWTVLTTSRKRSRLPRLADMVQTVWRRRHAYSVAQVDVYSGNAFVWAECVCWALRRAQKPYVLTLHGGNLPEFSRRWPGRVRRLLQSARAVTAPSPYLCERMKAYRNDLLLVPNAIDLHSYPFRCRTEPRAALVWLRAFHETYNPSLAPRIVAALAHEFPEVTLAMIGPDKGDGSLRRTHEAASSAGVLGRIAFRGGVPKTEVPSHLDSGDVFLNTTNFDNTPVSVVEAMACGLCIASTNAGGLPHLLTDGQTALLAPPNDAPALAQCVRRILTERGLAESLSRTARERAKEFDWATIMPQWERLLMSVDLSTVS